MRSDDEGGNENDDEDRYENEENDDLNNSDNDEAAADDEEERQRAAAAEFGEHFLMNSSENSDALMNKLKEKLGQNSFDLASMAMANGSDLGQQLNSYLNKSNPGNMYNNNNNQPHPLSQYANFPGFQSQVKRQFSELTDASKEENAKKNRSSEDENRLLNSKKPVKKEPMTKEPENESSYMLKPNESSQLDPYQSLLMQQQQPNGNAKSTEMMFYESLLLKNALNAPPPGSYLANHLNSASTKT